MPSLVHLVDEVERDRRAAAESNHVDRLVAADVRLAHGVVGVVDASRASRRPTRRRRRLPTAPNRVPTPGTYSDGHPLRPRVAGVGAVEAVDVGDSPQTASASVPAWLSSCLVPSNAYRAMDHLTNFQLSLSLSASSQRLQIFDQRALAFGVERRAPQVAGVAVARQRCVERRAGRLRVPPSRRNRRRSGR